MRNVYKYYNISIIVNIFIVVFTSAVDIQVAKPFIGRDIVAVI